MRSLRSLRRHIVFLALAASVLSMSGAGQATATGQATGPAPSPQGAQLWRSPSMQVIKAYQTAAADPSRSSEAALLKAIADQPQGIWLMYQSRLDTLTSRVATIAAASAAENRVPTFVLYALPHLDCQSSGAPSATAYRDWVDAFAAGLSRSPAIVIVEPDALALLTCLSTSAQTERLELLRYATARLALSTSAWTYLDAGHAGWQSSSTMASRLTQAGVATARGFSLNVSNYGDTASQTGYGRRIAAKMPAPQPFVIDVGRNGLGATADAQWCNAPGRALGVPPTTVTGQPDVDAYLWVKPPGESDGSCGRGEPRAGTFWTAYAVGLAERSTWAPTWTGSTAPSPNTAGGSTGSGSTVTAPSTVRRHGVFRPARAVGRAR